MKACLPSLALLFVLPVSAFADDAELTFERHIRPIFKVHCIHCHGEAGEIESDLDLRLVRLMTKGGYSGPAIVPGDPDKSYLVERLRAGEMPPGNKKLPKEEIDTIVRWIAAGAKTARPEPKDVKDIPPFTEEDRDYWAFQPIVRPAVPNVANAARVANPIDSFLLHRLEGEKLAYSPETDRRTLIRRASFDLLGLPPTPEEIDAFLADTAPGAWERLIDRLLASPHYGERWGRHWLDVAGYADSEGYAEADQPRPWAFRYRDYVIRAFNSNMPFDRFIQEQLAGDEMVKPPYLNLSPEDIDKLAATGFLRMAPDGTASPGVEQPVARNQNVADTMQIVSTALMGMTVACAQCHDHKYDPIPHVDYFRMRAIFEPALDWKSWKVPAARRISLYTDADRKIAKEIQAEAAVVDKERQAKVQEFIDLTLEEELAEVSPELREPLRTAYKTPAKERTAEQNALLKQHPSVMKITSGSLYLYDRGRIVRAAKIEKERAEKEKRYVAETRARELEKVPEAERAAVEAARNAPVAKRTSEQADLLQKYPGVEVTAATLATFNPEAAAELQKDLDTVKSLRAAQSRKVLQEYTDRAAAIRARIPTQEFIRALTEPPGHAPATHLFHRGDYAQPKQTIPPGGLRVLSDVVSVDIPADDPNLPTTGRRLAFARILTSGKHPLTARVIVNRLWLLHFGRGIVNSPGDFGFLGERPTHPELLDWLATEFMESGWDVKHMHRLMMASSAYRQSSARRPEHDVDPDNRLLARMSIRRLEAEIVRDALLSVSGQRNDKLYGEPVPVMEDEVGQVVIGQENLDGERKPGKEIDLKGEERRRSVYIEVRRSRQLSMLETFDAPEMTPNCEVRNASTAAAQSLTFMNSTVVIEHAEQFARRLQNEAPDTKERIALAWELAFGREPAESEIAAGAEFVTTQQAAFQKAAPKAAAADIERKALTSFCQALFSANAFLYVD